MTKLRDAERTFSVHSLFPESGVAASRGDAELVVPSSDRAEETEVCKLQAELRDAKQALEKKIAHQRELDRELVELKTIARESERQLSKIRSTLSYRLGAAVVDARTPKGLVKLPKALWSLWRVQKARRVNLALASNKLPSNLTRFVEEAMATLRTSGPEEAAKFVRAIPEKFATEKSRAMLEVAGHCLDVERKLAVDLALEAGALSSSDARLRTMIVDIYDRGSVKDAASLLAICSPTLFKTDAQLNKAYEILEDADALNKSAILPAKAPLLHATTDKTAIIVSRALPRHAEPATFRARAVVQACTDAGKVAEVITSFGYGQSSKALSHAVRNVENGVPRYSLPAIGHRVGDRATIRQTRIDMLTDILRAENFDHVHILAGAAHAIEAASAARLLGIGYSLDVGSLPAAGAAGRAGWSKTERSQAAWERLLTMAEGAEAIVVRSQAIADAIHARNPDLVLDIKPDTFKDAPTPVGRELRRDVRRGFGVADDRPLIGIVCENAVCEDIGDFVSAILALQKDLPMATLVYCGSSRPGQALRREAARRGAGEFVLVPDSFVRQRLHHYLGSFDTLLFPYVEDGCAGMCTAHELRIAKAMGQPITAIDCSWAREPLADYIDGRLVKRGDVNGLVSAISSRFGNVTLLAAE